MDYYLLIVKYGVHAIVNFKLRLRVCNRHVLLHHHTGTTDIANKVLL